MQAGFDRLSVRREAALLAVVEPGQRRGVAARAVAGLAGGDLVLQPRRPALQARDHVLERQVAVAERQFTAAPDAFGAVAREDVREPLRARKVRWSRPSRRHGDQG
jgi:hypothetical protein